ncbi:MAG: hypothetical protein M3Z31_02610 [Pseudomonadota bacterium]|nr:hypothetical protein [Pseudomonadota bacterium]
MRVERRFDVDRRGCGRNERSDRFAYSMAWTRVDRVQPESGEALDECLGLLAPLLIERNVARTAGQRIVQEIVRTMAQQYEGGHAADEASPCSTPPDVPAVDAPAERRTGADMGCPGA